MLLNIKMTSLLKLQIKCKREKVCYLTKTFLVKFYIGNVLPICHISLNFIEIDDPTQLIMYMLIYMLQTRLI